MPYIKKKNMNIFKSNWGPWIDLSVGYFSNQHFLLQAKRHKNGKVKYRVEVSKHAYHTTPLQLENLNKVICG